MMANPTPSHGVSATSERRARCKYTKRLKMPIAAEAKAKGPTIEIVLMYFEPKSTCTTRLEKTVSVPAVKMPTNVVILRAWMKTLRLSLIHICLRAEHLHPSLKEFSERRPPTG